MQRLTWLTASLCLMMTLPVTAGVFSPRVQREGEPDAWSVRTLLSHPVWRDLNDAALARVLVDVLATHVAVTPFSPREGTEKLPAWAVVNDPLKLWHAYGLADRAAIADAFAALWQATGRGAVRVVELSGSPCVLVEIESGGQWGVIDPASRAVFLKADGSFAAWDEIPSTPALWEKLGEAVTFPHDDIAATRTAWAMSKITRRGHRAPAAHTASFLLRRGEKFTRFATPQGERWQLTDAELKDKKLAAFWNESPRGPKTRAGGPAEYAHGRFDYEPSLKSDDADVRDGADLLHNVAVTADGLTLTKAGEGSAIFRVASPFPIVGEAGKIEDGKDDKDASVIEIDAAGATLSYSRDFGATWISIETKTWPAKVDLTQQVAGTYGYQLRIELKGKPNEAIIRSLKITTWVQCSPLSFPALKPGENTFRISTGDERGLPTQAMVIDASTADENGFLRPVIRPPKEYRPGDANQRVIGPFTLRVGAPVGSQIAWMQLGGRFATKPDSLQPESVGWGAATGSPQGFQPLDIGRISGEMDWAYVPDAPIPAAFFRVDAKPALNQLRMTAHCFRSDQMVSNPWRITHRWTAGTEPREHAVEVDQQETYTVTVNDAGADSQSLELAVPGSLSK